MRCYSGKQFIELGDEIISARFEEGAVAPHPNDTSGHLWKVAVSIIGAWRFSTICDPGCKFQNKRQEN